MREKSSNFKVAQTSGPWTSPTKREKVKDGVRKEPPISLGLSCWNRQPTSALHGGDDEI